MDVLYAYKTIFTLDSKSSLEDFWSYLIFRLNLEQSEFTYDCFARLYNHLSLYKKMLSPDNFISITLEESSLKYLISLQSNQHNLLEEFHQKLSKFSFIHAYTQNNLIYFISKKKEKNYEKTIHVSDTIKTYVYDFISEEELDEMSNILDKMNENNEEIFAILDISEINDYRTTFSYYSSYMQYYSELHVINNIVTELSVILSLYSNECQKLGNDFRTLLKSFLHNLIYWQKKIFVYGTEPIDFMNDSLKADLSQIKIILNLYDEETTDTNDDGLDDIFDF